MAMTRREFVKVSSVLAAALGVKHALRRSPEALAAEGAPQVVWLQCQSCSGCSVSLLNTIRFGTIDQVLTNTIDLQYHPTLMAGAGDAAVQAALAAKAKGGYILVVEGSIPTGNMAGACYLWPGTTALAGVKAFAAKAKFVIAVGTCASYGGIYAGKPNPTGAKGVRAAIGKPKAPLVNLPGCPAHPDWILDTVGYILTNRKAPSLDSNGRPKAYYRALVHDNCTWKSSYVGPRHHSGGRACTVCHDRGRRGDDEGEGIGNHVIATYLSDPGCMWGLGCKGTATHADCPIRRWNAGSATGAGVNWCIGAKSPCHGCTEPKFPDGMSPFYTLEVPLAPGGWDDEDDEDGDDD